MAIKEGNLEAPTRHPLDWQSEAFYDEKKLTAELDRVFEICHGCRRCVSLCGAFPTLFDLIDATADGELEQVDKAGYSNVVDQCYLCDICYVAKCPYVPPHPYNLDFPHLMLRAKALQYKKSNASLRDNLLSSTDKIGRFAGIPVVTAVVNRINQNDAARGLMEQSLGVDKSAWLPQFASRKFDAQALASKQHAVKDGARSRGKVALYATCYVNFNEPGIGLDLLAVLDHNQIPYVVVEKDACCGMPKLELGDLESVQRLKEKNIPRLARLAHQGYAILSPIPSCTLMFKQELPLMFPDDAEVAAVKAAMCDPFEYLMARHKDGLLATDFMRPLGKVSYHMPCHSRVQNMGRKTMETLALIPGTEVKLVERCSGHSGTWGVKKEFHAMAMKIGKPVFRAMGESEPDFISSDCQLSAHHIAQGMAEAGIKSAQLLHPISLVARAYGLSEHASP